MRVGVRAVARPNPAPGADFNLPFSANEQTHMMAFMATLVTSATVANRMPRFTLLDPNGVPSWSLGPSAAVVASASMDFLLAPGIGGPATVEGPDGVLAIIPIPDFWIPPGWSFRSTTPGLAAGDQWTNLTDTIEHTDDAWDIDRHRAAIAAAYDVLMR